MQRTFKVENIRYFENHVTDDKLQTNGDCNRERGLIRCNQKRTALRERGSSCVGIASRCVGQLKSGSR